MKLLQIHKEKWESRWIWIKAVKKEIYNIAQNQSSRPFFERYNRCVFDNKNTDVTDAFIKGANEVL